MQDQCTNLKIPCPDADAALCWIHRSLKSRRGCQPERIFLDSAVMLNAPHMIKHPVSSSLRATGIPCTPEKHPESNSSFPLDSSSKEIPTTVGTSTPTLCRAVAVFP